MLQGDLGQSYKLKQDVSDLILARLPVTFELILFSVLLAVAVAIPLGAYQAYRRDTRGDYAGSLFALVAVSSPGLLHGHPGRPGVRGRAWASCPRSGAVARTSWTRRVTCCCPP